MGDVLEVQIPWPNIYDFSYSSYYIFGIFHVKLVNKVSFICSVECSFLLKIDFQYQKK